MPDIIAQGLPLLSQALETVGYFKYPLLFLGAFIEGPLLAIASGFLLHSGILSLWPLYVALGTGDLVGDVAWYMVGRFLAGPVLERHGKFLMLTPELFEKLKAHFHRRRSFIMFTSKITMGLGMALGMIMAAGAARIPFRSFLLWNALGEIVYLAMLLSIGYFMGNLYGVIAGGFKMLFIVTSSIVIVAGLYLLSRYLRNRSVQ